MKTLHYYFVVYFLCTGICLLCSQSVYADDMHHTFINDFSGENQEEKAFLRKLRQDEKKIELAIKNTKVLIEKSKNKPYLPELYLRLADLYVEKSRVIYFIRKAEKKQPLTSLEALPANALKNQAIEVYQRILDHFPLFDQIDKIHFYMAHEYRELGKIKDMILHYRNIIQSYPNSQYVAESYLLLGDHYFKSQDLDMAQNHYSEILKFPDCPAFPIAQYKLGWCHINRAEFSKAIKRFEMALASASNQQTDDIDTYRHVDIRLESLIDMAYCYVDCYKDHLPETAIHFFQTYAWSLPSYISCLEKLANRYFIKKKWHHCAVIYRKLSELQEDTEKNLSYARKIFECVREMNAYDQTAFDVNMIVKTLKKQRYTSYISSEEKRSKEKEYEVFAREMITLLHERAKKIKSKHDLVKASDAYIVYLDFFQDSPVFWEMTLNCAESLFASEKFFKAGKYYEQIYHDSPNTTMDKKMVLFSAMTSYYHALKNKDRLNAYEKNFCRQGLLSTGRIYVDNYPSAPDIPDVLFNMAWIAYDEGQYDVAIKKFKSFIQTYPNGRPVRAAVHLVLDAYYMKEDFKSIVDFGRRIIENPKILNKGLKTEVSTIVSSAEQKIVYSLSLTAIDDWEKGRSQMFSMAKNYSDTALGEKALVSLLGPSLEKKDIHTFFQAGNTLIQKHPESPDHEKTLILLIQTSMTMGQYVMLAHYLKTFCFAFPAHKDVPLFLEQSSRIYQQLGDYQTANHLFEKLFQLYSHRFSNATDKIDSIIFQWSDNLIHDQLMTDALSVLKNAKPHLSKKGQIMALSRMACIYDQLGKKSIANSIETKLSTQLKISTDPLILDGILEMKFSRLSQSFDRYMKCQMAESLDEKLLKEKQTLFSMLQKEYSSMLSYPSHHWVLAACAHLYQLYHEFAHFLRDAPCPDSLTEAEQKQYLALIEKKALSYDKSAEKFRQTFQDRSQTWANCSPRLFPFIQMIHKTENKPFSQQDSHMKQKTDMIMPSTEIIPLYQQRLSSPDALTSVYELAKAYLNQEEWGQLYLLCNSRMEFTELSIEDRSLLLAIQGLSLLYQLKDFQAQQLFEKALAINSKNESAMINLAGLMVHYLYISKAKEILAQKPMVSVPTSMWIHPKARRLIVEKGLIQ